MHILGDGDPIKAVLPVGHFPVHVPKLGTAVLRSPGHLQGTRRGRVRLTTTHEGAGQGTGESEMRGARDPLGKPNFHGGVRGDGATKSTGPIMCLATCLDGLADTEPGMTVFITFLHMVHVPNGSSRKRIGSSLYP